MMPHLVMPTRSSIPDLVPLRMRLAPPGTSQTTLASSSDDYFERIPTSSTWKPPGIPLISTSRPFCVTRTRRREGPRTTKSGLCQLLGLMFRNLNEITVIRKHIYVHIGVVCLMLRRTDRKLNRGPLWRTALQKGTLFGLHSSVPECTLAPKYPNSRPSRAVKVSSILDSRSLAGLR